MTYSLIAQERFQSLLDEMLDLVEEYEYILKTNVVLSVKRDIKIRIKKIQNEILEVSQLQNN